MFDALVHRQDGKITRAAESSMAVHPRQVAKHAIVAVGLHKDAIHKIGTGQVQAIFADFRGIEPQKKFGLVAQQG